MLAQQICESLDVEISWVGRRAVLSRDIMELKVGELLVAHCDRAVRVDERTKWNGVNR
jgi:hypothetical protein